MLCLGELIFILLDISSEFLEFFLVLLNLGSAVFDGALEMIQLVQNACDDRLVLLGTLLLVVVQLVLLLLVRLDLGVDTATEIHLFSLRALCLGCLGLEAVVLFGVFERATDLFE